MCLLYIIVLVRVSYKGEYIMTEEKDINDVEAEALHLHQLDLKSMLTNVQILLCQLKNLQIGKYIVAHFAKDNGIAAVYSLHPSK